ncbi:MAG TPA: hypothetical protein VM096_18785 [Vicinamibacterales bacterium]|nr:hypothetical protein [Vicinamibacterales bacterium]
MTGLVPSERHHEHELETLRARVAELEVALGERSADAARTKSELDAFRIRYRQDVGLLHEELDRVELALAEAELGILTERLGDTAAATESSPSIPEPQPRFTTDAVRKLFRDVAKAIHPDLTQDEVARERRHALMIAANRAYAVGDEEQLRSILSAWERSPEAVEGTDAEAMRLRLVRRIAQIEEQLDLLARAVADVQDTSLWKLKAMVDEEAAKGNDLIKDMVRRLKRDILVATNRLDALRPPR